MILYKSPLIFGIIRRTIKIVFTVVYKILAFFNLQFTLLLSLIGLVLYLTGVFNSNQAVLVIFYLLLVLSIIYAIVGTVKILLGIQPRVKKSKGAQIIEHQVEQKESTQPESEKEVQVKAESPTYFTVKQNNNYIMAEYSDRYELYRKTEEGLKKVRTDFK